MDFKNPPVLKTALLSLCLLVTAAAPSMADDGFRRHKLTIVDAASGSGADCAAGELSGAELVFMAPSPSSYAEMAPRQTVSDGWLSVYADGALMGGAYLGAADGALAPGAYRARIDSAGFLRAPWLESHRFRLCSVAGPVTKGDAGGAIEGTLTESGSGDPVTTGSVRIFDAAGVPLGTENPNETGFYSFGSLAPGTYFARTEATGLLDELWDDMACAQGDCVVTSGSPIVVADSPVTADFVLDIGASISGTVTEDGPATPITSGWVEIFDDVGAALGIVFLDGSGNYAYGGLDAGTYFARTSSTGFVDELWDNLPCALGDCVVTSGTAIVVVSGTVTADFALGSGGAIAGSVTSTDTALPIVEGDIHLFDSVGTSVGLTVLTEAGTYEFPGLDAGTYYVRTESTGYSDELWDDIPCADGVCTVTSGTAIVVAGGTETADFALDTPNSIVGTVTQTGSGTPITAGWVTIFDSGGSALGIAPIDGSGSYVLSGLDAGTYLARTEATGFLDELWDDIPCVQTNCVVTTGSPIVVSSGATTADFALDVGGTIAGMVIESGSATPVLVGSVNVFDAGGVTLGIAPLGEGGFYSFGGLAAGTYFARTESTGLLDELFSEIPCAGGACDPTTGTAIVVSSGTVAVDFALGPMPSEVFSDGFESGDTSAWSLTVGATTASP